MLNNTGLLGSIVLNIAHMRVLDMRLRLRVAVQGGELADHSRAL